MGSCRRLWEGGDAGWVHIFLLGSGVQPLMPRACLLVAFPRAVAEVIILEAWALDLTFLN